MKLAAIFHQQQELAKEEGRRESEQREQALIIRLINRRVGEIDPLLLDRVRGLSIEKLEELGEALLDFSAVTDLEAWLAQQNV
jgi:Domain of unknown function (DUF4351)